MQDKHSIFMTTQTLINYPFLWDKITDYARKAGRAATRPVLSLYYVLKSPATPKSDKLLIISALFYLVLPIDLISTKRLPIIGWIDEVVSITVAYEKVCKHITPEIRAEVENLLDRWFREFEYEIKN
jgi:uncharacterized membrane protein YkvA (DUF1232 family)